MPERACFELCWRHARGWIRTRSRWLSKDEAVALPPDDDIGGPSASTTACRSGVVESACLPLRTAQAAKARSNATVGFALSLLGSLVRSPQSRNQWWLSPQPVALSVGRSPTENERPPLLRMHKVLAARETRAGRWFVQCQFWAEPGVTRTNSGESSWAAARDLTRTGFLPGAELSDRDVESPTGGPREPPARASGSFSPSWADAKALLLRTRAYPGAVRGGRRQRPGRAGALSRSKPSPHPRLWRDLADADYVRV